MDTNLLVTELLRENFPTECETVGPTNLEDIVGSEVGFAPAKYGSTMDIATAIQVLVVASTFVKAIADIYTTIKKETGRDPDEAELVIRIKADKDVVQKLDKHVQERLTKSIMRKLREKR